MFTPKVVTNTLDLTSYTLLSGISVVTLGRVSDVENKLKEIKLDLDQDIVRDLFHNFVKMTGDKKSRGHDKNGTIALLVASPIYNIFQVAGENLKDFPVIGSTLYAGSVLAKGIVNIAGRIADLAIGIFAAILAIAFLGQSRELNSAALRHCRSSIIVQDAAISLRELTRWG
jgi:hypothetical protein